MRVGTIYLDQLLAAFLTLFQTHFEIISQVDHKFLLPNPHRPLIQDYLSAYFDIT